MSEVNEVFAIPACQRFARLAKIDFPSMNCFCLVWPIVNSTGLPRRRGTQPVRHAAEARISDGSGGVNFQCVSMYQGSTARPTMGFKRFQSSREASSRNLQ